MPITYDIKTDYLYQEGKLEGRTEGKLEGRKEEKRDIIIEMLKDPSMTEEKIAKFTQTSVEYVRRIKRLSK